jgi:hypothetical protein
MCVIPFSSTRQCHRNSLKSHWGFSFHLSSFLTLAVIVEDHSSAEKKRFLCVLVCQDFSMRISPQNRCITVSLRPKFFKMLMSRIIPRICSIGRILVLLLLLLLLLSTSLIHQFGNANRVDVAFAVVDTITNVHALV